MHLSLPGEGNLACPRYIFTTFESWICPREVFLSEREADHCSGIMRRARRPAVRSASILLAPIVLYAVMRGAAADRHPEQGNKTH